MKIKKIKNENKNKTPHEHTTTHKKTMKKNISIKR